jgi:ribosomal protein L24
VEGAAKVRKVSRRASRVDSRLLGASLSLAAMVKQSVGTAPRWERSLWGQKLGVCNMQSNNGERWPASAMRKSRQCMACAWGERDGSGPPGSMSESGEAVEVKKKVIKKQKGNFMFQRMGRMPGPGDAVRVIGGKYAGRSGTVVKVMEKMYAIRLCIGGDVVRVPKENVTDEVSSTAANVMYGAKMETWKEDTSRLTAVVVKAELIAMREQLDKLIGMMEKLQT